MEKVKIRDINSGWEEIVDSDVAKDHDIGHVLPIEGDWELVCYLSADCHCDSCVDERAYNEDC